jgi:hypothetical protein
MSNSPETRSVSASAPQLWRWKSGRQASGYDTFALAVSQRLRFDSYLIRYREGAGIPPHRDPAPEGKRHYRLNVILWPARKGGDLACEAYLFRLGPIKFFRPDLATHSVSPVEKGTRYVFSVGWLRG